MRRMARRLTSAPLMPGAGMIEAAPDDSGRGEANRQAVEPVDAGDAAVDRIAVELQSLDVRRQEAQALLQLGAREGRPQAVVDPGAEGRQTPAVGARDVEAVGVLDAVAVGRAGRHE